MTFRLVYFNSSHPTDSTGHTNLHLKSRVATRKESERNGGKMLMNYHLMIVQVLSVYSNTLVSSSDCYNLKELKK